MTVRDRNQSLTPKTNMSPENSVFSRRSFPFGSGPPLCREHWSVSGAMFVQLRQVTTAAALWSNLAQSGLVSLELASQGELGHWKSWKKFEKPWVGSTIGPLTYPTLNLSSYLYFPGGYYRKGYMIFELLSFEQNMSPKTQAMSTF